MNVNQPIDPKLSKRFPNVSIGYVLAGAVFVLPFIESILYGDRLRQSFKDGDVIFPATLLVFLTCFIYWLVCVYRLHKNLEEISNAQYPITGARAVVFHCVPLYNLYWVIKWPSEVAKMVNGLSGSKKMSTWAPGVALLLALLGGRILDGSIGLLVDFAVLSYLVKHVKQSIQGQTIPIQDYASKCPVKGAGKTDTAVIVIGVILGGFLILLLLAIAIPNFLRAREDALQRQRQVTTQAVPTP